MQNPTAWWQRPAIWASTAMIAAGIFLVWPYLSTRFERTSRPSGPEAALLDMDLEAEDPFGLPEPIAPAVSPNTEATSAPDVIVVYITGAVVQPDVYSLPSNTRTKDVVIAAGGFADDADSEHINLAARVEDAQHIHIPRIGEDHPPATDGVPANSDNPSSTQATSLVNINTASLAELEELPGIGRSLSQRIIDYRSANGPFTTVTDLKQVKGIGPGMFAEIEENITVEP